MTHAKRLEIIQRSSATLDRLAMELATERERNEDLLELLRQISIRATRDGDGPFMLSPALVEAAHAAVDAATKRS